MVNEQAFRQKEIYSNRVQEQYKAIGCYDSIKLDTVDIPQSLLNIENKERSNSFAWNGQFSPQLIEILLSRYAPKNGVVFDPFVGSGTVLYEAGCLHLEAYGTEINPSAYKLARVFRLINCSPENRSSSLIALKKVLNQLIYESMFLVPQEPSLIDLQLKKLLIKSLSSITDTYEHEIFEALIILLDFYKNDVSPKKISDKFKKLRSIIIDLPFSEKRIDAFNCDARNIPLSDKTVDIVLTSPPYINVFNYHQNYRASVEALGWDVLSVAKSEIGSNRKNRGNRILTVIQYCIDMAQCLKEMSRVLKDSGRIIMIVGRESCIRKTPFYNAKIISEIGVRSVGLELIKRQERVFKNKFGSMIYEDILHFSFPHSEIRIIDAENEAKNIARETLIQSLSYAPNDSKTDIESAIDKVENIEPSPIYEPPDLSLNTNIK